MKKPQAKMGMVADVERGIQGALAHVPGLNALPEPVYIETVLTALELVTEGLKMRQEELQGE